MSPDHGLNAMSDSSQIDALCKAFDRQTAAGKPSDLYWAFRCMTMDIVTYLCFGSSVDAINAPEFKAPIIAAMDASYPVVVRFKHSFLYKDMILGCPPKISKVISPSTRGLVDMQLLIKGQIQDLVQHPEKIEYLPHNMTIYHCLMDKEAYRSNTVPSEGSLYEETQALLVAGSDTTGNALMVGSFHLLKNKEIYFKFKTEIQTAWETAGKSGPEMRLLETLPYLNAVIKESLRLSVGVTSGLPRVVPQAGATIAKIAVPGGVCFPV
jgi:cytochrome P450